MDAHSITLAISAFMFVTLIVTSLYFAIASKNARVELRRIVERSHSNFKREDTDRVDQQSIQETAPLVPSVSSGSHNTTHVSRVKILSQNVWGHYFVGGGDIRGRLSALVHSIRQEKYDVVLLQELFTLNFGPFSVVGHFSRFAKEMTSIGLCHMIDPYDDAPAWMQNSGLAVFSRFPIIHSSVRSFPVSSEPLNGKGVAVVTIDINNGQAVMHLGNFHPDSRNNVSREQQINFVGQSVKQHIAEVRGDASYILIAGDANVCSTHNSEYSHLCDVMAGAGAPYDLFPGTHEATFPDKRMWLDHMFVSSALLHSCVSHSVKDFRKGHSIRVSDHLGIEAAFSLPPEGAAREGQR